MLSTQVSGHHESARLWKVALMGSIPSKNMKKGEKKKKEKMLDDSQYDTRSPQTTTTPQATTQARAGALMFPSSCLDGGITRVGPSQYPLYTRAIYGGEAVGSSSQQHSTALNEPKLQHGSGATVEHSSAFPQV